MPSSAPRAISLHFWHGRSGAASFKRFRICTRRGSSPGSSRKPRPSQSNHSALVRNVSPKCNSMPSAAALRSISWSTAEPAPRWRQSSAIDMPNSPARSAHESATRGLADDRFASRYCRGHEQGQGVTTIGSQSTRQFRRRKFACGAQEPIVTRSRRKPSDIVLQSLAIGRRTNRMCGAPSPAT